MSKDYLTMARIMKAEWVKWRDSNKNYHAYTGFEQIAEKNAFEAGFMAGFSGRYFEQTDK
jgi:hypothetical protein